MTREFRLKPDIYAVPVLWEMLGIALSVGAFFAQRPGDFWGIQALSFVLFHAPSALGVWWIFRTRILVDNEGIYFRGPLRTQCVAWNQIEDFGWELPGDGQSKMWIARLWVGGKKRQLLRLYKGFDELREIVAERATKAPTREWELVGTRDCDVWPQTFTYRDTPNWKIGAIFLGMTALMTLQLTGGGTSGSRVMNNFTQTWGALEWWGRLGFVGVMLFMLLGMPTLMTCLFCLGLRGKRRFLEQSIVVSREGLEQWNGPSRRTCAWEDVERFELEQMPGMLQLPLCVVWARGQRFDWHSRIEKRQLLAAIVKKQACNAQGSEWKYPSGSDEDILGGELSLWPSGVAGVGPKRYHYRTRTCRALLFMGWAIFAVVISGFALSAVRDGLANIDVPGLLAPLLLFSPVIALSIGGLRAYLTSWLERDEAGLHHTSLFGKRELCWSDIERVQLNEYYLEIGGAKTKIRVGPVADQVHLLDDIESRSGVKIERAAKLRSGA